MLTPIPEAWSLKPEAHAKFMCPTRNCCQIRQLTQTMTFAWTGKIRSRRQGSSQTVAIVLSLSVCYSSQIRWWLFELIWGTKLASAVLLLKINLRERERVLWKNEDTQRISNVCCEWKLYWCHVITIMLKVHFQYVLWMEVVMMQCNKDHSQSAFSMCAVKRCNDAMQ
jgi:hypothetical protein